MIPEKVVGFHACAREFARQIEAGELSVADWQPSRNEYDWLGHGIYFWEGNLPRARQWAMEAIVGEAAIIEAEITLGECLDPTLEYQEVFPVVCADLAADYARRGWAMCRTMTDAEQAELSRRVREIAEAFHNSPELRSKILDELIADGVIDEHGQVICLGNGKHKSSSGDIAAE